MKSRITRTVAKIAGTITLAHFVDRDDVWMIETWYYGPAPITPTLLRLDPLWDPLRGDHVFQKLCEEKQK